MGDLNERTSGTRIVKEFRVGKMNWDGKVVQACLDKGLLQIVGIGVSDGSGGMQKEEFRVRWYNTDNGSSENEVSLGEGAVTFEPIENRSNVFVLKVNDKPRNIYWIRDNKVSVEELLSEINSEVERLKTLHNRIESLVERIMGTNPSEQSSQISSRSSTKRLLLSSLIGGDIIRELREDRELINELRNHMPESQRTDQDVVSAISCPQVRYTLRLLDETIYSSQFPALSAALGLGATQSELLNPNSNPMIVFINALNRKYGGQEEESKQD